MYKPAQFPRSGRDGFGLTEAGYYVLHEVE